MMDVFHKTFEKMPNVFQSYRFSKQLKDFGYLGDTKSGIIADYLLRYHNLKPTVKRGKTYIKDKTKEYTVTFNIPKLNKQDTQEIKSLFENNDFYKNTLIGCTDIDLINEIKKRGYTGTLNPPSKPIEL